MRQLRDDFPAVGIPGPGGVPTAQLDNAATTQKPEAVLQAIERYYREGAANPYRGTYRASRASTSLYEGARREVAHFIGAAADEVVFTRNATEALNLVACCYGAAHLRPGDEVVLTRAEHHSNLVVWQRACRRAGASLVYLELDEEGRLQNGELERAIGPATKIVALAHVSNVLGTVFPVARVAARAHDQGAIVVLDCAQSAAHLAIEVKALGVDFAAFSGHKIYGPMGAGFLYGRSELLEELAPFLLGGEMVEVVLERSATFVDAPRRFEAGTPDVASVVGLAAALRYVQGVGFTEIGRIERDLGAQLLSGLNSLKDVRIVGNPQLDGDRCPIVSFTVSGTNPHDVALMLDRQGRSAFRVPLRSAAPPVAGSGSHMPREPLLLQHA